MSKKVFHIMVKSIVLLTICLNSTLLYSQTYQILNNDRLRVGNGSENSINSVGNMQQPFYYNGDSDSWRKLTYSTYPLDIRWGVGGDGSNSWNINGTMVSNPAFSAQTYDYSNFTVTDMVNGDGYGIIKTTGQITINGQQFLVENSFDLPQGEGYIEVTVKLTNQSLSPATNVRLWVGTRDDWVGTTDGPLKERGNLVNGAFELIANQNDQAKAIKVSTTTEAILFYSNSDRAYSTINSCCSFTNATNQNPATNDISRSGDGSYALYVRMNDLGVNESDELVWYYAGGTLADIDDIVENVANAAGAFENVSYNSADYLATSSVDATGYWILVPDGATVPTEAEIKAGVNYGAVNIIASGNANMTADLQETFNLSNLDPYTTYDFYFVTEYDNSGTPSYTSIIAEELTTLESLPIITSITPNKAAYGETVVISGQNFLTTSSVLIDGQSSAFTVVNETTINLVVPSSTVGSKYIQLSNESGSSTGETEVFNDMSGTTSTGWSSAWQKLNTVSAGTLREVILELANTSPSSSYDMYLELHDNDDDPSSPSAGSNKFDSLIAISDTITIASNSSKSNIAFNFLGDLKIEAASSYYIVLKGVQSNPAGTGNQKVYFNFSGGSQSDGGAGGHFGRLNHSFTMSPILEISNSPTDIDLTSNTIEENNNLGDLIGILSTSDADLLDTHVYSLVSGSDDEDNSSFIIEGSNLKANDVFDFEIKNTFTIRIRVTDEDENIHEEVFNISVDNDNDEDSDGVDETSDNCPDIANPNQLDTNSDGEGDICDDDDDGDGTPDATDDFPLDENEDTDTDGDGTGDNADTDDDDDGTPDASDDFPLDENEDTDTDGDGTGDNADTDDDDDGTPDATDDFPLDENEDTDTDGDGTGDNADTDDDDDGTPDASDDFPLDENEDTDTDGDGTGDNADTDDDDDGTPDASDDFPLDENEDTDTDGDGTGDNADTDDDDDGTPDASDDFPLDENEDTDTDGDGTGDNADTDDDDDGTTDASDDFPLDENEDTDTDGDGTGDNADTDDDDDGTPDASDDFPLDENEDTDTDGDGTGDNADTDDDDDGTTDASDDFPLDENEDTDTDGDGTGDNADTDDDDDGTPDASDDFPLDENEDTDTDGDGTGDNADTDDDDDGTPDATDDFPLDENEDTDTDGDGTGDNADTDDDDDGTPDASDDFPLDENEDTDTDGDGTGDNADTDDDDDGTPDASDDFPLDENEDTDTDGDGTGDNADTDDDNDGTTDASDDFPLDENEDTDTDGDGTGDNADTDDDNDGTDDIDDVFPLDSNEDTDTDWDGIGDNADEDDDGDGFSDIVEEEQGSNSKDEESIPVDTDEDGISDILDNDDDNDGVPDSSDDFPLVSNPKLTPAEAFTPNGDGMNEAWVIPGIDNYPNNTVKVFNRWGHIVFSTKSYRNNWEGFYKDNKEKLPAGSYMYVIDLGDGSTPIQGWIYINY